MPSMQRSTRQTMGTPFRAVLRRSHLLLPFITLACASRSPAAPPTAAVTATPAASISLAITRWEPPKLDPDRRAKFEKLVPELDKMFAEAQRTSKAPGLAVGIVVGGETVYAKGFGLRDVDGNKPFTADTPFPIASVTKSFTAMAILKLRDEGKLDLDGPASRYYPPLAKLSYVTRDAPPVTLRHLLTHTSGMPEDNPWADVTENLTDADLAALLDGGVMSRVPGARFEYANIGYGALGRVVERVSGMPTREYIRRALLEPLGMTRGGWEPGDLPAGTVAVGYRGREGSRDIDAPAVVAPAERLGIMDAAGGLYTTVSDMSRYVAFHLSAWPARDDADNGPVRRSTLREMQQGSVSSDFREMVPALTQRLPMTIAGAGPEGPSLYALSYGFGLQSHTTCEATFVEHSGGLPGYLTFLSMLPREGIGMFVFINDERARANVIAPAIRMMRAAGLVAAAPNRTRSRFRGGVDERARPSVALGRCRSARVIRIVILPVPNDRNAERALRRPPSGARQLPARRAAQLRQSVARHLSRDMRARLDPIRGRVCTRSQAKIAGIGVARGPAARAGPRTRSSGPRSTSRKVELPRGFYASWHDGRRSEART
jgi:CubicO group peptidase (beta-lactamase class C family)